jgi:hypothetical protein
MQAAQDRKREFIARVLDDEGLAGPTSEPESQPSDVLPDRFVMHHMRVSENAS